MPQNTQPAGPDGLSGEFKPVTFGVALTLIGACSKSFRPSCGRSAKTAKQAARRCQDINSEESVSLGRCSRRRENACLAALCCSLLSSGLPSRASHVSFSYQANVGILRLLVDVGAHSSMHAATHCLLVSGLN
jgi:hypothetical protein